MSLFSSPYFLACLTGLAGWLLRHNLGPIPLGGSSSAAPATPSTPPPPSAPPAGPIAQMTMPYVLRMEGKLNDYFESHIDAALDKLVAPVLGKEAATFSQPVVK